MDTGSFCTLVGRDFLAEHLSGQPVDPLTERPRTYYGRPIPAIQGMVNLKFCFAGRDMNMTVYVVGNGLKSLIGRDLIRGLGISLQGKLESGTVSQNLPSGVTVQTPMPGPYPTSFQHAAVESQGGYSLDSTPVPGTVMKVHTPKTSPGRTSVPEQSLKQNVLKARTECVGEEKKVHTSLTVDTKKCSRPQWHSSVKPLFRVGSLVLARCSRKDDCQTRNR